MTAVHTKRELFDATTAVLPPEPRINYFRYIDNKITDIALKFIGGSSLTLGVGIAVGVTILVGASAIPIILVPTLIGVGLVCFFVRSHFKRYHDTNLLNQYKKEALEVVESYAYLDKIDFIQGADAEKAFVKKHVLRPLKMIISTHHRLENIFIYKLLTPEDFKKAFDLEIKYLPLPEAIAFYEEVSKALANTKASKFIKLDEITPDNGIWKAKFLEYVESNKDLFDNSEDVDYEKIKEADKVIRCLFNAIEGFSTHKWPLLNNKNQKLVGNLKKTYLEKKKKYSNAIKEGFSTIVELEKIKENLDKKYMNHRLHYIIWTEQQAFLAGIKEVRNDEELRLNELDKEFAETTGPICMRNDIYESDFDIDDLEDEDKKLYAKFHAQYEKDKEAIKQDCKRNLNCLMQAAMSSDFTNMKKDLKKHRADLDNIYNTVSAPLLHKKAKFMGTHADSMSTFRDELIELYDDFFAHIK